MDLADVLRAKNLVQGLAGMSMAVRASRFLSRLWRSPSPRKRRAAAAPTAARPTLVPLVPRGGVIGGLAGSF
jgi:hypothetical protein